ncbi:transposase domain-containing protein [Neorhizobium sp. P12A]|uniref:transposase domain-containing protein n=1 Tax=Neorhizobium sp. P12A TaxID=2268027 RepID=UPI0032B23B9E
MRPSSIPCATIPVRFSSSSAIRSLIEAAKLNSFDAEAYLRIVLFRIVDHPFTRVDEQLLQDANNPRPDG